MWLVEFESPQIEKEVATLIRSKKLTIEDQSVIHAWIQQVTHYGPESIRGDFKWSDPALHGDWDGYRSSAFSNRGRIIYKIVEQKILIQIARITVQHEYKKGK
jgi:mRNA-degrading endonuclease YafQ of YafQ-DinJ toxin-antitoxin module